MNSARADDRRLHLRALGFALLLVSVILVGAAVQCHRLIRKYVHALAPMTFPLKDQGTVLQRAAFAQSDLLPLYGSSELVKPIPDKAALFFHKYPTDFEVCPVGKAGTTPLIMLQKFAAVGDALRGRKVAISISPGWFFVGRPHAHYYDGNFSLLHAGELVFGGNLSHSLQCETARRMLAFPNGLKKSVLLQFAVQRLAGDSISDRMLYDIVRPLGRLENAIMHAQDDFEFALYLLRQPRLKNPQRIPREVRWERAFASAERHASASEEAGEELPDSMLRGASADEAFLKVIERSSEWTDLELLLRGLRELGAEPLLLTMPTNPRYFDSRGISRSVRDSYFDRLQSLARKYDMPLVEFREHADDPKFLVGLTDHLTTEGWMFYDKALDDFYHGRRIE